MKKVCFIIAICFLTACVPTKRLIIERINFPTDEYTNLVINGTGKVKGQAFLKTRGGDVKKAAGNEVWLNPVTSYSTQWFEIAYKNNNDLTKADQRYLDSIIYTVADADGRFEFENVPSGKYYLVTKVTWEAPTGYKGALQLQGGLIAKLISVNSNNTVSVILTR